MRIGDNLSLSTSLPCNPAAADSPAAAVPGFILTPETGEICAAILARMRAFPAPQERGILLDGRPGVGKTHLLRFVAALLQRPDDPAWEAIPLQADKASRPAPKLTTIHIALPEDSSVNLGQLLLARLRQASYSVSDPSPPPPGEDPPARLTARLRKLAGLLAAGGVGLVVLDDVTARMRAITDPEQLRDENRFLDILLDVLSPCGILVCLAGDDIGFKAQEDALEQGNLRRWEAVRIRRRNIAQVVARSLAVKSDVQRLRVKMILDRLRKRLPTLDISEEVFVDLYPIHPHVFPILFDLRRRFPGFSPLQFARAAILGVRGRPEEQLISLDQLYDHVLPDLRQYEHVAALVAAHDELQAAVLPRLKPSAQTPASSLLKGIALLSLCETLPPTVKTLAHALLLCPDSGPLSGCGLAAALLMEVEQHAGGLLDTRGELLERTYRLRRRNSGHSGWEKADDTLNVEFSSAILRWFHSRLPRLLDGSQVEGLCRSVSFRVALPGQEGRELGIFHIKSIFDPLWSSQDLGAIGGEGGLSWVILVLNPLERFYELEKSLQALSASPHLLIWRPDQPLQEELQSIRAIVSATWESPVPVFGFGAPAPTEAFEDSLTSLYVRRGQLIWQGQAWNVGDALGNRNLEAFVADFLGRIVAAGPGRNGSVSAPQTEAASGNDNGQTLTWAALLTGREEIRELSLDRARESVLSWWSSHFEIDPEAFRPVRKSLPEAFMTTGVDRKLKMFEGAAELLESAIQRLRRGEIDFARTMELAAAAFCAEESRARAFATLVQNLPGFVNWLPEFERMRRYLNGAFQIPQEKLEQIRREMLRTIHDPLPLLEAAEREKFNRSFHIYKSAYVSHYQFTHEESLRFMRGHGARAVDSVALRNLELLSGLQYMSKSYINRVGIVGKWIQGNRCSLPVRQILETRPRCHCNFNPADYECIGDLITQINDLVREGVDHFRTILRGCGRLVLRDIQKMRLEESCSHEIASLLKHGPMLPLKSQSVDVLNRLIQRHSAEFLAEIQKHQ